MSTLILFQAEINPIFYGKTLIIHCSLFVLILGHYCIYRTKSY